MKHPYYITAFNVVDISRRLKGDNQDHLTHCNTEGGNFGKVHHTYHVSLDVVLNTSRAGEGVLFINSKIIYCCFCNNFVLLLLPCASAVCFKSNHGRYLELVCHTLETEKVLIY